LSSSVAAQSAATDRAGAASQTQSTTRPANEFAAYPFVSKILSNKSLAKPRPSEVYGHQGFSDPQAKVLQTDSTTSTADGQERPLLAQSGLLRNVVNRWAVSEPLIHWWAFQDTYRTLCVATPPEVREIFENLRAEHFA
jgi:hypothetical protein